jgi:hypothetical protein
MSILPLGPGSLKYGSNDGGKTIHFDDPVAVEVTKRFTLASFQYCNDFWKLILFVL